MPRSISPTPGRATSPTTVATAWPGDAPVPMPRNHSAPRVRMWATLASVSTLLTSVGLATSGSGPCPGSRGTDSQPIWEPVANSPCS
jgi:hypothetical protein